jgi:hypothetical protein
MKIACLYYGQPRFTANPYCYESHKKFIFDRYDTDIYAHLWWDDENQNQWDRSHVSSDWEYSTWLQMENCPKDRDDLIRFVEKWKPSSLKTENPKEFSNEKLFSEIKNKFDSERFHRKNFHNQLSQLYSIEQVGKLLGDHKSKYDFIITIRTDLNIWDYPNLEDLNPDKFYLSSHSAHFPDLGFIFGQRFTKILNAYTHTMNGLVNLNECWAPVAEAFKFSCYNRYYSQNDLMRIPLPLRLVRGVDCKGPTW